MFGVPYSEHSCVIFQTLPLTYHFSLALEPSSSSFVPRLTRRHGPTRSFFELTCFALSVPGEPRWIATVNVGSQKSREKMDAWFKRWAAEKKKREASGRGGLIEYRSIEHW